jgi:pyruvate dehydrogenase E2 component (dihydrolipoamide acetyltransferase)
MATPVEMPRPGITVEECLLVKWRVRKGEPVAAGQVIAEIETDKAGFEVEAPVAGTLLETFAAEGELVPVFTNICVIGQPGEDAEPFRPRPAAQAARVRTEESAASSSLAATEARLVPSSPELATERATFSPRARRFAQERGFFPEAVRGSGPGGRVLEEDLKRLYFASARTSPLARELVRSGFEAPAEGSGVNRLVRAADLSEPPMKLAGAREIIARRMRESLASTAQYTLHASAEATGLLSLRRRLKESGSDININDLVMYCVVRALEEAPELNAELIDGRLYRRRSIHLGFACDTPRGLLVPVIRNCQELTLEELAARAHRLADQASSGAIDPGDLAGATFTVSNLGSFGIESFTPIINPPQVAVLGVNAIQLKPIRRNGAVEFVDYIGLSLTLDHQVIDGAPGARFLQKLRQKIEEVEAAVGPTAS